MKKYVSVLASSLLLAGVLGACAPDREEGEGSTENNGGSGESTEEEKPESLKVWVNDSESQKAALDQIFEKYTEETGIEVDVTPMNMLDQIEALNLDGPAGNGPDLFFQPHDRIGSVVLQGLAAPLDLGDTEGDYSETAIEAVTYDGEIYGAPLVVETYATFYNKDLVDEAPVTVEDLTAVAEEQTDEGAGTYGFLMEAANFYFSYPFFGANGAYVFNNEGGSYDVTDIGLNNEGAVAGGELIQSWYENGYIPIEINPDVMNGLFTDGKVATVISGPWNIPAYEEALGDSLGTAILPTVEGTNATSFVGVKSWMVSDYSENKEWATDLALFITNEENSTLYFEEAGEMPANQAALEGEAVTSNELISAFAEQIQYGTPMPSTPEMQQVWDPINNALQFIAQGNDVKEVLDEAVQTIEDNIATSQQ
ncbi:sugar ABC transporter substrate-binding protein [Jeotgalibacillus proteolyticus]|uniref:Maltodextrin-binding protein n=1 Tax=Jeotgalibacillus proteolyticus TaxID=2082395 RepID=A0A2S5GHC5_9BACL|nr:extracellular solute-binding protein [Jeotgalibacillus proteolyticus]PPA72358.1 ABC transporter substrate-binding protein [Jeotgalibacillus proteolyticus]